LTRAPSGIDSDHVKPSRRNDAFLVAASLAVAVALFACSGDREAQGVTPGQTADGTASAATDPKTSPTPAQPVAKASQAEQQPADQATAAEDGARGETTFGTELEESEEETARPKRTQEPLETGGHVFTNKDLHRYRATRIAFGMEDEATGAVRTPASAGGADRSAADPADPNTTPDDHKTLTPEEQAAQIQETQDMIARAEADLNYLRSRPASIHNPFLPRVQPSDEDAAAESGMDNVQRLAHVESRISDTEKKIAEMRQKLEALRSTPPPPSGENQ